MQDFRMETFLAVCQYMNFTRAAEAMNLTQPAVSQHIRYLENAYGVPLFQHVGRRVQLTAAGRILYESALTMKHDEQHMRLRMQQAHSGIQNYAFGATLTVAEFMLVGDLERFIRSHPQSHIRMQVANTRQLLQRLDSSELDFAVVEGDFLRAEYDCLPYARAEYGAVACPAVAERCRGAELSQLLGETLILREPGSGTREILEQWLARQGLTVEQFAQRIELGNIGAINAMVRAGLGITFCYRAAVRREEEEGTLVPIHPEVLSLTHEIMFIFRKNSSFKSDYLEIYRQLCGG